LATACSKSVALVKTREDVLGFLTGANNGQGISYLDENSEVCPFQ